MIQLTQTQAEAPRLAHTAILFTGTGGNAFGTPSELLHLIDRPMLQHVVECLVRAGCQQLHVVLGDEPLPIKALLGDGTRWGCRLVYHHAGPEEQAARLFRRIDIRSEKNYFIANAGFLPSESVGFLLDQVSTTDNGRAAVYAQGESMLWSGWGVFEGFWLLGDEDRESPKSLATRVMQDARIDRHLVPKPLSASTPADLLESSLRLLEQNDGSLASRRRSHVHPTATIHPPAYIGHHVKIGPNAVVGPHAVLCEGAFVDRNAHVENALVLPHTYVGEELNLRNCVVQGTMLANTELDTVLEIADSNLLSALPQGSETADTPSWRERMLALALHIFLAPLQLLSYPAARHAQAANRQPIRTRVIQPANGDSAPIEFEAGMVCPEHTAFSKPVHFHCTFYPGLAEVARGRLRLVGPTPRSAAEVRTLPEPWQVLYLKARCGLLNETQAQATPDFSAEMQFASDAMACATQQQIRPALKLLARYLGLILRDLWQKPIMPSSEDCHVPENRHGKASSIHHRPV